MHKCQTEEEFLKSERESYDRNAYIKEKNYTENMVKDDRLQWQLMQKIQAIIQGYYDRDEIHLLLNGHNAGISKESLHDWYLEPYELAEKMCFNLTFEYHETLEANKPIYPQAVIDAVLSGVPSEKWYGAAMQEMFRCTVCGRTCKWETNGVEIRPTPYKKPNEKTVKLFGEKANDYLLPCQHADDIKPFTTQLKVTSGKIVVDDDLREAWPELAQRIRNSICNVSGRKKETLDWAEHNVVACPNSNMRPHFAQNIETGEYIVATPPKPKDDEDAVINCPEKVFEDLGYTYFKRIYTDLWWVMIADHDEFVGRGGDITEGDRYVVEVPNGVYEITHYEHVEEPKPWGDDGYILTEMKWISD